MALPAIPMYGGMLDLKPPVARCCTCGWEGIATVQGAVLTECPRCEGARDEDASWLDLLQLIAYDPFYLRLQLAGNLPLFKVRRVRRRALEAFGFRSEKVARNAPCPCGSGVKFKKCHG